MRPGVPRETGERVLQLPALSPLTLLSISAHLLPALGFSASASLRKHCPAPGHCKLMKAPIVQHPCEGLVLRFLWGQGNAERQLTTERGRAKLRSFDSPIAREPICSLHAQQPGKRCNVRIPREESSVHRARAAAAPEGDVALSRGLPVGEVLRKAE